MNLIMIRPKTETEELLLSINKDCETLIKQTFSRPQKTLEFKITKPRETFHFNPPTPIEVSWILGLTSLEIYNSIFVTEHNIKFELYTNTFDDFSSDKVKNELEEILSIIDITPYHLQHETIGPRIIEANKKIGLEKASTDGYLILILGYARSPFRDFESNLRIVVGLDEDDIRWIKKQYKSNFITYELSPGIYSIKDIAQDVYTMGGHDGTLEYEYDDNTMKTNFV